ncbi:MAG: hypothetical protein RLZZ627_1022, partial [Pseudomonadota bacterium]
MQVGFFFEKEIGERAIGVLIDGGTHGDVDAIPSAQGQVDSGPGGMGRGRTRIIRRFSPDPIGSLPQNLRFIRWDGVWASTAGKRHEFMDHHKGLDRI